LPDSLQVFNLWRFSSCDSKYGLVGYPGRIPGQIIENLLYYFTREDDLIVDPFAGGGTTIDVCKAMNRRVLAYDIRPSREDIQQYDIMCGFPEETKGCQMIFLDPPYWKQKRGEYSNDKTNLANVSLEKFYDYFEMIIISAKHVLQKNGYLVFIIGNTVKDGEKFYHSFEMAKIAEKYFKLIEWVSVPYSTQQVGGNYVNMARENKRMLNILRDVVVFRNEKV